VRKDPAGEWRSYAADKASSKYLALDEISARNFTNLQVVWTFRSPDEAIQKQTPRVNPSVWEATPLMVGGVLYVSTSLSQVAAIEAATGRTLWVYDPESWKNGTPPNQGYVHRGVTYWTDGTQKRIFIGTGDAYLICLDAQTGQPVPTFGTNGRVDLTQGLSRSVNRKLYGVSSPPIVCRDVVAVGSSILDYPLERPLPPGDVRGFDARTGKRRWTFQAIPTQGMFGSQTWERDSAKNNGSANVWTMMSADEDLGYLYLPLSTPSNDYFGGDRPGNGLFGESLVCVEAQTGKRVWHFQIVHHGLWDYDLPAAPNLVDISVHGKKIQAVAQVSKQAFCYVFDRVTGKPVWPIEERPVAPSTVPGEKTSATQPFPTKPAAFDRQGFTQSDVMDYSPELKAQGLAALKKLHYGPLFTPPALDKPTINLPGVAGGASWAGATVDPETGILYVPSVTLPFNIKLVPGATGSIGTFTGEGMPLYKPPYARVTAIDLNSGAHKWMTPIGQGDEKLTAYLKSQGLPPPGRPARGHVLLTKTLLLVAQEGTTFRMSPAKDGGYATIPEIGVVDPALRAYNKQTGALVGEVTLPRNASGAPMTYRVNGRQYIVVPTGGANLPAELIALALPETRNP
jgi:quinoprotein glucose dehydrogenase